MTRIAINGLGRIGKLILRALEAEGTPGEVILMNDPVATPEVHAHLLEFDTVHGRWDAEIGFGDDWLSINGRRTRFTQVWTLEELPLAELGVQPAPEMAPIVPDLQPDPKIRKPMDQEPTPQTP